MKGYTANNPAGAGMIGLQVELLGKARRGRVVRVLFDEDGHCELLVDWQGELQTWKLAAVCMAPEAGS